MSLADRLKEGAAVRLPSCSFCRLLMSLPVEDAKALSEAAENPDWTTSGITLAVRAEGYAISEKSISRHRKGACLK
jgi:hypothetical protein